MDEKFEKLYLALKKDVPGIRIGYKDSSKFMKLIGGLLFFNKGFMTDYITTIGKTIYFPNKESVTSRSAYKVLAHEYVHIKDSERYGSILYSLMYLFPQILALFGLLFLFKIYFVLFFICLLPLPAYWRSRIELRGYAMSLFMEHKEGRVFGVEGINDQFIGSGYYWMWPFGVKKELHKFVEKIESGDILSDEVFAIVNSAIDTSNDNK